MLKKFFSIFLLILIFTSVLGRAEFSPTYGVTILPLKAFVDKVYGEGVNVVLAVPQGASPESYEPSPLEMRNLANALAYFSIGMPTEAGKIIPFLGKDTEVVPLDEIVASLYPDLTIDGGRDPHIWISIKRAKRMVEAIVEVLSKHFPDKAESFASNAALFYAELDETDNYIKEKLANIADNKFIAFHPAFQYFAEDYGLEMYALEDNGKEATAKMLERMFLLAKENNIRVIFMQDEVSARQAEAFAEAIGGKVLMLSPLAYEYTDNLKQMADVLAEVLNP